RPRPRAHHRAREAMTRPRRPGPARAIGDPLSAIGPAPPRGAGGWLAVRAALAAVLLLSGCAGRAPIPPRPPFESLPPESPLRSPTLGDSDAWIRHHLLFGEYPRALEALDRR